MTFASMSFDFESYSVVSFMRYKISENVFIIQHVEKSCQPTLKGILLKLYVSYLQFSLLSTGHKISMSGALFDIAVVNNEKSLKISNITDISGWSCPNITFIKDVSFSRRIIKNIFATFPFLYRNIE